MPAPTRGAPGTKADVPRRPIWWLRWLLPRRLRWRRRWRYPLTLAVTIAGVLVYAGLVAFMITALAVPDLRNWYTDNIKGPAGGLIGVILGPTFLALAAAVFYVGRYHSRIVHPYLTRARERPQELLPSAAGVSGDVIGREEFCTALIDGLDRGTDAGWRGRRGRRARAHIVVGPMGSGKSALILLLTRRLAEMGAVPVPVSLREAGKELDFCDLALTRFTAAVSTEMASKAEAEKAWRWLLQRRQVVVLADGLEEALLELQQDERRGAERDNLIRRAVAEANDQGLPLIVTSRPHDPLRSMDATITELEPLNQEASLKYVARAGTWTADSLRVSTLVETAGFDEAPLYLQMARQLHEAELLEQSFESRPTDDRARLRHRLFETWLDALIRGRIYPHVALRPAEREAAVEYLSALALVGLERDSAEVAFTDLLGGPSGVDGAAAGGTHGPHPDGAATGGVGNPPYPAVMDRLARRLGDLRSKGGVYCDAFVAARWGQKLGLVDAAGDGVRFRHSMMQAYLGSRYMALVVPPAPAHGVGDRPGVQEVAAARPGSGAGDPAPTATGLMSRVTGRVRHGGSAPADGYFARALAAPGRELLAAMVLFSRGPEGGRAHGGDDEQATPAARLRDMLCDAAAAEQADGPAHRLASHRAHDAAVAPPAAVPSAKEAEAAELGLHSRDARTLDLYATAVEIDAGERTPAHVRGLWHRRRKAPDGCELAMITSAVSRAWPHLQDRDPEALYEAKIRVIERIGAAVRALVENGARGPGHERSAEAAEAAECAGEVYRDLLTMAIEGNGYPIAIRLALEIGNGGETAFRSLKDRPGFRSPADGLDFARPDDLRARDRRGTPAGPPAPGTDDDLVTKGCLAAARLLPLLMVSAKGEAGDGHGDTAQALLDRWLAHVGPGAKDGIRLPLDVEAALAQGFRFAANRRHSNPWAQGARAELSERAEAMLQATRLWYARLTLLHACTLWALPDDINAPPTEQGPKADPRTLVHDWLRLPDGTRERHPFVLAGADLAIRALRTRRPERFLWTDETIVAGHIGSRSTEGGEPRKHNLWIPYSIGWSALVPQAQQLVADVLLTIGLAEQGDHFAERRWHMRRLDRQAEPHLPPCLTEDRSPLDPCRTGAGEEKPAEHCHCAHFNLCPYPARSRDTTRVEFSETFCQQQKALVKTLRFRRPPWQRGIPAGQLRGFWAAMAARTHDREATGDRRQAAPGFVG